MGLWDDLWPNLEFPPESVKRRKFLHWVEKTHDNDMADKIETAERVVRQDIFNIIMSQDTSWVVRSEEKKFIERATLEREENRGGGRMQEKGHHIMHVQDCHVSCSEFTAVRGADPFPGLAEAYCAHIPVYIWAPLNRTSGNPRQRKLKQDMLSPRSRENSPGRHHNQVPGIWEHCGEHLRNLHRLGQWPSRCKKKGECPPWSRPVAGRQSR